ncbi:MAG: RNA polymerase sigma factor [Dokdonella sp.]|nr:RNA polymerase sigma factor [Dokdonella sp.]
MSGFDSSQLAAPLAVPAAATLDAFLRGVERRAWRVAELAIRQRDDAVDLVQEAMFGFVRRYGQRTPEEWAPLFWRVLDSRIHDWHRRHAVRSRWTGWLGRLGGDADEESDPLLAVADGREPGPLARLADREAGAALDLALRALPLRQRQAFLLRIWEGLDVAQTATAMRCSQGSVKTHLSRALARLREQLEPYQ